MDNQEHSESASNNDIQDIQEGIIMEYTTQEYEQVINYLSNQQTISICILVALGLICGLLAIKTFGDWFK